MSDERCGMPIRIADLHTYCARPIDHDGECLPLRSELMRQSEWHDERSDEISKYITTQDRDDYATWPHEGPKLAQELVQ